MNRRILAAMATTILVTVPASARNSAPAPWSMITFDMRSWGQPMSSWSIAQGGIGSWTEAIRPTGARLGTYTLVVHDVQVGDVAFRELAAILRKLPDPAPDYDACENAVSDMPYGTIRLTRGSTTIEVAWNSGCQDRDYAAFLDTLKSANQLVERWGRASPELRREDHGKQEPAIGD